MIVYGVLVGFLAVAGGVLLCVFPGQRARLAAAWRGFAVMGGAPVSRFSRRLGGVLLARPAHAAGMGQPVLALDESHADAFGPGVILVKDRS